MTVRNHRRCDSDVILNAYAAVCGGRPHNFRQIEIGAAWDLAEAAGFTRSDCEECGAEEGAEHEEGCFYHPNWEPSDDDLDLSGEGAAAAAESTRRSLRDAGRDGGVW